jgi:hypothetical protein
LPSLYKKTPFKPTPKKRGKSMLRAMPVGVSKKHFGG